MYSFKNILKLFSNKLSNAWSLLAFHRQALAWPTKKQWKFFFKVLTKNEKIFLSACIILILISSAIIARAWYLSDTKISPASGGTYTEAAIGSPRYINPVLATTNDVDRDLSTIIFSSLMRRISSENISPDLAESYSISDDKKTYDFKLRENVKWHDGIALTADDIIYTVNVIQDPQYRSPLRNNLQGVEIVKTGDFSIRFTLKNPYDPFLDNLTFGILPKHIWENTPAASFSLSENNLKPIGSGPYKFIKLQKDSDGGVKNIELQSFSDYFSDKAFIKTINFQFYKDEPSAIAEFNAGSVDGISYISPSNLEKLKDTASLIKFNMPRYFAVFFNTNENKALADKSVRQAFLAATDKQQIINDAENGQAVIVNSPVPSFIFGENSSKPNEIPSDFGLEKAKNILDSGGWQLNPDSKNPEIRQKNIDGQDIPLEINITTVNWPELISVANLLKTDWEKLGATVNIDVKSVADIQGNIKDRQYQALLFGQILSPNPDPFSFWHSSQIKDPGLNLAQYNNKDADKLLENIRQESNPDVKMQEYNQFQDLISQDVPAIFLYSPLYIFPVNEKIKGINLTGDHLPQDRFAQINKWYINTKRAWK
jgi:peptide/nickel transport system substrate-binding protein